MITTETYTVFNVHTAQYMYLPSKYMRFKFIAFKIFMISHVKRGVVKVELTVYSTVSDLIRPET